MNGVAIFVIITFSVVSEINILLDSSEYFSEMPYISAVLFLVGNTGIFF